MLESISRSGNTLRAALGHARPNSRYRLGAGFLVLSLALMTFCVIPEVTRQAGAEAAAPPVPGPSEARLAKLVAGLGAAKFAAREAADRALEEIGAEAMPALLAGARSTDPEVRNRSRALVSRVEKQTAAYFEALGAGVHCRGGDDRVAVISYSQRDPSKLADAHLRKLVGFPWLESVYLHDAKIGDAGLAHLGRLPNLIRLDLTGTRITDAGLAHLVGLTNLESLCLHGTQVTGRGFALLGTLKKLRSLSLFLL